MPQGYMGRILWVDLSQQRWWVEQLPDAVYRQYLGGYGLGVRILWDRMRPGVDPLGPDNILGFVPGLLTGTGMPFSGRFSVVCKSPLTGGWGDANCGGHWGPEFRRCGFDGLFIVGQASAPTYLVVERGQVRFCDARDLWGLDALAAEERLRAAHGKGCQAVVIGPAGERLALIAGIVTDRGRVAARSGVGAVMGAKRLKAVVVRGHLQVARADPVAFRRGVAAIMDRMGPAREGMEGLWEAAWRAVQPLVRPLVRASARLPFPTTGAPLLPTSVLVRLMAEYGTATTTAVSAECGDSPVRNWAGVGVTEFPFHRAQKLAGPAVARHKVRHYACSACPLHCGAILRLPGDQEEGHRPEYETLAGFGTNLLIDDLDAICQANELCNRYGLDTISTAAACAFAFECYERGLITAADCGGVALRWGDAGAMLALVRMIGERQAIGDLLADGVRRAAERIGRGAEAFAMHCGGQEMPFHDPRLSPGFATTYLCDPTPGRHTAGGLGDAQMGWGPHPIFGAYRVLRPRRYAMQGQGRLHAFFSNARQVEACLGLCKFSDYFGTLPYTDMVRGATGWDVTDDELLLTGERIQHLRQAFNVREGIRPAHWRLPDRVVGRPPLAHGPLAGVTLDPEALRAEYFAAMQWDLDTGRPDPHRLAALGLADVAAALWGPQAVPQGVPAFRAPAPVLPADGEPPQDPLAAAPGGPAAPQGAVGAPPRAPAGVAAGSGTGGGQAGDGGAGVPTSSPAGATPRGPAPASVPEPVPVTVLVAGWVGGGLAQWHGTVAVPPPATVGAVLAAAEAASGLPLMANLVQVEPVILVDGNRVDPHTGLNTPVRPGDTVAWLTPISGG